MTSLLLWRHAAAHRQTDIQNDTRTESENIISATLCVQLAEITIATNKEEMVHLRRAGGKRDVHGQCLWCWPGSRSGQWTCSTGCARMQCWYRPYSCCHAASWYDWDEWRTMTSLTAAAAAADSRRRRQRWMSACAQPMHRDREFLRQTDVF